MPSPRWQSRVLAIAVTVGVLAAACSSSDPSRSADPVSIESDATVPTAAEGPRPIVVDTDMGAGDIVALAFLLEHPDVEVRAITVSGTGLVHCGNGVQNVLSLLEQIGAPTTPVACGSETPMGGAGSRPEDQRQLADSFYGLPTDVGERVPDERTASQLIADAAGAGPGPVTVLTLGPLTNLARSVEETPDIVSQIDLVYSSVGALSTDGSGSEWNLLVDPEAASRVLESGLVLTFVRVDTAATLASMLADRFESDRSPGGRLIDALINSTNSLEQDTPMWDALTAAAVVDESVSSYEMTEIAVLPDGSLTTERGTTRTRVATGIDLERFDETVLSFYSPAPSTSVNSPPTDSAIVEGRVLWEFDLEGESLTGGGGKSKARVEDGVVYFVGFDQTLYAVSSESGELEWSRPLDADGPAFVEIAVSPEAVFYRTITVGDDSDDSTEGSTIGAADRSTGDELWSLIIDFELDGTTRAPAYADGAVFYGGHRTGLRAADANTGNTIWSFEAPMVVNAGVPAVADGVVYFGASDGSLYAVDAASGDLRWRARTQPSELGVTSTPAIADGVVYFGSDSGQFLAVDADTGETIWEVQLERVLGLPSSPVVADGRVYFGSLAQPGSDDFAGLWAFDAATGDEVWRFGQAGGFVLSSPTYHDGDVYFIDSGKLFVVDSETGRERWRYEFEGISDDSPSVHNGIVYFQARDSFFAIAPPG